MEVVWEAGLVIGLWWKHSGWGVLHDVQIEVGQGLVQELEEGRG
jgi:hypothetical protein